MPFGPPSGGLETRQFTFFIVTAVVCLTLYAKSRAGLLTASFSLAAAELTRPEGLLLAACCFAWFALQHLVVEKRISAKLVRQIAYLVAPFALLVAAHFLFRYAYYGEWLPNTYYAKHVRPWYESGFRYLSAAALETGLYILLPLAYLAMHARWQTHRDGIYALVLLSVVAHMAYLLPIGGDLFEYRPLDFYWPPLGRPRSRRHRASRHLDSLRPAQTAAQKKTGAEKTAPGRTRAARGGGITRRPGAGWSWAAFGLQAMPRGRLSRLVPKQRVRTDPEDGQMAADSWAQNN